MKPAFSALSLFAALSLSAALGGCATTDTGMTPGLEYARLGQTVNVGGPQVTPLELLEDSRCPPHVECMWGGQVKISARITLGSGTTVQELTSGVPIQIADGTLELVDVRPDRAAKTAIPKQDYRFGLRFMGGF